MALIEDYAIIGDTQTVALVSKQGSIDWLCLPRFDSPACFAALLGDEENGAWRLAPVERRPMHLAAVRGRVAGTGVNLAPAERLREGDRLHAPA